MVPERETYRAAITAEIAEEMSKADDLMRQSTELLRERGYETLAEHLMRLYLVILPTLVRASPQTPVHHAPRVVHFLARLLLDADPVVPDDLKIGLTAALFHDSGFAFCKLRKIAESEIEEEASRLGKEHPTVAKLVEDAIKIRLEHAELGAEVVDSNLERYVKQYPDSFTPIQIDAIKELVLRHDHLKIATLRWQLGLDVDRQHIHPAETTSLVWDHLVADLSWMLSDIEVDRERDRRRGREPKTPLEQLAWNQKCHRDIPRLYEAAFPEDYRRLGFLAGLPIITDRALNLYLELEREVRGRCTRS